MKQIMQSDQVRHAFLIDLRAMNVSVVQNKRYLMYSRNSVTKKL